MGFIPGCNTVNNEKVAVGSSYQNFLDIACVVS